MSGKASACVCVCVRSPGAGAGAVCSENTQEGGGTGACPVGSNAICPCPVVRVPAGSGPPLAPGAVRKGELVSW